MPSNTQGSFVIATVPGNSVIIGVWSKMEYNAMAAQHDEHDYNSFINNQARKSLGKIMLGEEE
jgi:hypothetical protein